MLDKWACKERAETKWIQFVKICGMDSLKVFDSKNVHANNLTVWNGKKCSVMMYITEKYTTTK